MSGKGSLDRPDLQGWGRSPHAAGPGAQHRNHRNRCHSNHRNTSGRHHLQNIILKKNKTKVISADLLDFDLDFEDIYIKIYEKTKLGIKKW